MALNAFAWCATPQLTIHLFVDNTSVLANLERQKAPPSSFVLNSRIIDIKQTELWSFVTQVEYVHTKLNPADDPSRQQEFNLNEWIHLLRTVAGNPTVTKPPLAPERMGPNLRRLLETL